MPGHMITCLLLKLTEDKTALAKSHFFPCYFTVGYVRIAFKQLMFPSFEDDIMTAFSRDCRGKNTTSSRLLGITTCLLSLRTETVKPIIDISYQSAWHADLSFDHVCGVRKGYVVQGQDGSFAQP